jgi:hypothetical protein
MTRSSLRAEAVTAPQGTFFLYPGDYSLAGDRHESIDERGAADVSLAVIPAHYTLLAAPLTALEIKLGKAVMDLRLPAWTR